MHVEPVGRAFIVEDRQIDGPLEAQFILSKHLLIGHFQLGLQVLGLLLPI